MLSESATRKEIIDLRLREAGWHVSDRTQVVEEYFISPHASDGDPAGPDLSKRADHFSPREFSDYVLLGKNGRPLAVVEAKQSSKNAEVGREQAKQYCLNIQAQLGDELLSAFIRMVTRSSSGISTRPLHNESTASLHGKILNACSIFGSTRNRSQIS
jgi:Type I site-specific restriction-modification system, R (restriction) subunit and related helicases